MAADQNELPEGTDKIIEAKPTNTGALGVEADVTARGDDEDTLIITDATLVAEQPIPAPAGDAERPVVGSGSPQGGLADRLRSGRERLSGQAADKARGLVSQGLERGSEALANVGRLVGDTAAGLDERLGPEFGEYARRAASAIEDAANNLASKDADVLIEDTRNLVRKSPGVALAGAAIVGFALARLIKSGLTGGEEDEREVTSDDPSTRDRAES